MPGALTLARVTADCEIAGAPEKARGLVDRTGGALRHHLPDSLRRAFARWFDGDDTAVWIVRRLDVVVAIAADAAPDEIAAAFTRAIARALSAALRDSGDGAAALRFADRAAYLAQFVADAAADRAWGRWYYAPFEGLRLLPRSAAIRTALTGDPAIGLAALASLDDHGLARVVSALDREDETLLLQALASDPIGDRPAASDVYVSAWGGWVRALRRQIEPGRALFAYVRAAGGVPSAAIRSAVCAIDAVLSKATADRPHQHRRFRPDGATPRGDVYETPSHSAPHSVSPLPEWIVDAISVMQTGTDIGHARARADASAEALTTYVGGLLLLLRDLDACPWAAWTDGWPGWDAVPAAATLQWLTLASCAGRSGCLEATRDAVLRAYFDIPADLTIADAAGWLRQCGARRASVLAGHVTELDESDVPRSASAGHWLTWPRGCGIGRPWSAALGCAAHLVLSRFARRLPGFAESSPEHLWRNFLDFDAVVDLEPDRVVVRCGRPPLHLVLTLTGMTRGLVTGYDAGGRPWLLFSRE